MSPRAVRPLLRPVVVGFVLSACLAVAGCGGDSAPAADPPPSSPSASSSASAAPTAVPPGETAREFIERWLKTEWYAETTGDTATYRKLTTGCRSCGAFADEVEAIYAGGGRVQFGGTEIRGIKRLKSVPNTFVYDVDYYVTRTVVDYGDGKPDKRLPAGVGTYRVELSRNGGWRIQSTYRLVNE